MSILGAALGVGGVQLLSGMLGQNAASKERGYWKGQSHARRRYLLPYRDMLDKYGKGLRTLPAELRRAREGRMASLATQQLRRLRQNLGQAGVTGGSAIAQQEQNKQLYNMQNAEQMASLQERQAVDQARARYVSMGTNMANAMYPSPGQTAQGAGTQSYLDWTDPFSTAMAFYQYMQPNRRNGGGMGNAGMGSMGGY